jgi:diaminopimelate epimerase
MFYKIYSGAGNDFVMINNMDNSVPFDKQGEFTIKISNKSFPDIDGVIFVEKPKEKNASVRMNYYNRDGSFGAMCGNGARCIAQYSVEEGIISENNFNLEAVDKIYRAEIKGNNIVKIHFPPPSEIKLNINMLTEIDGVEKALLAHWVQVGSEHAVLFIEDEPNNKSLGIKNLDEANINRWGKVLRFHERFKPKGANVNFTGVISKNEIRIRTYERGVERETLACGTGIISSAVISVLLGKVNPPVKVLVQSGEWLTVDLKNDNGKISDLSLEGSAKKIDEGELNLVSPASASV